MVFELLKLHLVEDDDELQEIYDKYKSGEMLSGELKQLACEKMEKFMNDFNHKLEKARKEISHVKILTFNE
jgi:tryptophanyl-tRNA synthetase